MTGSDLIVLAPWILFGAGVSAVVFRLCRSGCSSPRASPPGEPSSQPESGAPGEAPHPDRPAAAGRDQREARS
jgi:hypothetical protein